MKRLSLAITLLLAAAVALSLPVPRPSSYYGEVSVGGNPVDVGVPLTAEIAGVEYAATAIFEADGASVYRIDVPGDIAGTPAIEGGTEGQAVGFLLDGFALTETGVWSDGTYTRIDLTAPVGADLSITKDDGVTDADPGDTLTYTLTITNESAIDAFGLTVGDPLPVGTTFGSASDGGTESGGVVTWPAFDLAAGASVTRTLVLDVATSFPPLTAEIVNLATVRSDGADGFDPVPANNEAEDRDALAGGPDLALAKSADRLDVRPGETIVYTLELTNGGFQDAIDVRLRDTLPAEVIFVTASDEGAIGGGVVTWPAFDMAVGETVARTVTVRLDPAVAPDVAELTNGAVARDDADLELDPSDNAATHLLPVLQAADLLVTLVDPSLLTVDPQALTIGGTVAVEFRNQGNADLPDAFDVAVFEDLDGDGVLTGADRLLGTEPFGLGVLPGETRSLDVPVSGTLLFRNNLIHAFVDSADAVAEHDETNNFGVSAQACQSIPAPGVFDPVVELAWPVDGTVDPFSRDTASVPIVVQLTDDNGDGLRDENDVPDIVFVTYDLFSLTNPAPYLRAISGDTGEAIFDVPAPISSLLTYSLTGMAAGDIDLDGNPEIVVSLFSIQSPSGRPNRLAAYDHNGTFTWFSPFYNVHPDGDSLTNRDNPSIADLDRDGVPEILVGATVFNNLGQLKWVGTGGQGYQSARNEEDIDSGAISIAADLDLEGGLELVTGNTAYSADGSIFWQVPFDDGYPAVANFDADPFPEIVVVSRGNLRLHEPNGALIWGPIALPGAGEEAGGAPTVANFDADPEPEIGVAGSTQYTVFEADGSIKWQSAIQDASSNMTGSTVFDLDGDGRFEVIYRDEAYLRIYRGEDGVVLYQLALSSFTANEQVVVADVDRDGNAEIVVPSNRAPGVGGLPAVTSGIFVIGDSADQWVSARGVWNQHQYHIDNVRDDGTIPADEAAGWLTHNTYRANAAAAAGAFAAPDVSASAIAVDLSAFPTASLTARIGNGGTTAVAPGLSVAFYDGDPAAGGTLIEAITLAGELAPGQFEDISISQVLPGFGSFSVYVVADDDGAGQGRDSECDEVNNVHSLAYGTDDLGLFLTLVDGIDRVNAGDSVTYTITVANANAFDRTGVAISDTLPPDTFFTGASDGGAESGGVVTWPAFTLPGGATAIRTLTFQVDPAIPLGVATLTNTASVADDGAGGPDPTPGNNTAADTNAVLTVRAAAGGPYAGDEGAPITFDGSGSSDRDGTVVAWDWDFDGDGTFDASGVSVQHAFADDGVFSVALRATDDSGEIDVDLAQVTVANLAPTVEAGADQLAAEGDAVTLAGATFTDPGAGDTHTATVDWGDGTVSAGVVDQVAGTVAAGHDYLDDGVFPVEVCVTDDDGGTGCDQLVITVDNAAPLVIEGTDIDLNDWNQEDLGSPGNWNVAADGLSVVQTRNADATVFYGPFTAVGVGLDASIRIASSGDDDFVGFVIGFQPGDFSNPSADYLLLDWKQANQDTATRGLALSRVFGQPTPGEIWAHYDDPSNGPDQRVDELQRGFTRGSTGWPENTPIVFTFETSPTNVKVRVDGVLEIDFDGDFNFGAGRFGFYNLSQGGVTYFLNEVAGVSLLEGEPAALTVPFSDLGVLDTHTATIDWQDGTVEAGTVVEENGSGTVEGSHVYPEQGDFEVEICVTDDEGATDCGLFPIVVLNAVPVVDAGGDRNAFAGEGLDLEADFVDSGTLDTHTATIDWGDGIVEAGTVSELDGAGTVSGLHSYAAAGTYSVEICVTDDDGGTGCDSFELLWFDEAAVYDAAIAKSANVGSVRPGEPLVYTLTVTNLGTRTPHDLEITDVLPDHLEFVSASQGGVYDPVGRTVSWVLPLLAYQSSVELRLVVLAAATLPFGTTAVNSASVPTAGPFGTDVNPGDNSAAASVVLWDGETPRVDLGGPRFEVEGVTVELDTIFDDPLLVTGSATIPQSGLIAYWSFNQRIDPSVDTVNTLFAQLGTTAGKDVNDPTYYCATEVAPIGGNTCGLNLVGRENPAVDDSVFVPNDPVLDFTDAYTVSAWVRLDSTTDHRPFFVRGANDSVTDANDIEIYSQSGSRDLIVVHNRGNGGDIHVVGFDNPPSNTFFHLAVTFDGTEVHAYYNGVEPAIVNQDEFLGPPLATGKGWLFGKVNHSAFDPGADREKFLDGRIDEVRFYDRALDAPEIQELAAVTGVSQTHTATVDWGDGAVEPGSIGTGGRVTRSHLYPDDFSTTLELCVTDDTGLTGCDSIPLEIENFVPEVVDEIVSGVEGDTLPLDLEFIDTGTLDTHTATIDWSDGTVEPGVVTFAGGTGSVSGSHLFPESAVYDTEVCVTDDDLGTGCRVFSTQIRNAAAAVDAGPDLVVNVGEVFALTAAFVDPGVLDTHTATFFWGDGSFDQAAVTETDGAGTATASHAYTQPGIRLISACVDDDDGARACDLVQVEVIGVPLPDLIVPVVDASSVSVDAQTLLTTGLVTATVRNAGDVPTGGDFVVTFFDDADGDGLLGPGDPVLGTEVVVGAMLVDEERSVSATVDYTADFAGDLIFAFADSGYVEAESNEVNNTNQSGVVCEFAPPTGVFAPTLEWSWTGSDVFPSWSHVIVTPLVGDITGDGIPDVVFSSRADLSGNCDAPGIIRAISGDGGAAIFDVTDDTLRVDSCTPLSMGDIDGDNLPEIIAHRLTPNGIMAFEHTGDLKWFWQGTGGATAIANIDATGLPEIVVGSKVLNADGTLRWDAGVAVSTVASVADLDLDGTQELVFGSRALNHDGTDFYTTTASLPDLAFSAVANFDADLEPEIVAVGGGTIWLLEPDGSVIWSITPPEIVSGGPPTIADYDGDGQPEVGVAGRTRYVAIDTDGTLMWQANTIDTSSRITGSSVFDFEADGRSEVVYNDHHNLRVYDGLDGTVLFQTANSSCTAIEYPVIADVDADGNAEIIVARNRLCSLGNSTLGQGIFVFGAGDSWVPTRKVWNQHAYHVTNVNSDLTIPVEELPSWLDPGPNSYRAQVLPAGNPLAAPDLTLSSIRVDTAGCPAEVSLIARLGNAGGNVASAPVAVAFYQGDPAGGVLLGTAQTTVALEPGEFEDVVLALPPLGGGGTQVCVVADEAGVVGECNEDNTLCVDLIPGCASADLAVSKTDGLVSAFAGQPIQYTVTVDNLGPDDVPAAIVTDLLPAALLGSTWTCSGVGGATCAAGPVAGDVQDTATLPAGGSVTYAVAGTIDAAFSGTLTNTATVTSSVIELDPANDSATDVTDVALTPELSASKDDSLAVDNDGNGVPSPGDEIGYAIVISNGGGAASGVGLNDLVPANTTVVAGSVTTDRGVVVSEDPVQVSIGTLGFGESATVDFSVLIDNPVPAGLMDLVNQGVVTSNEAPAVLTDDPALGGASDPTETMIVAEPMLVAEKTDELVVDADGDTVPSPGDTIEYTVTLLNNGNTSSTAVAFGDTIPANTSMVAGSVTTSQGTVDSEDPVAVTVGEITGGGASVEITFLVTIHNPVPAGVMDVTNQGEATSAEQPPVPTDDPDVGGDADPTVTMVAAEPELTVEKTDVLFTDGDGNGVASPGDVILYQITLDNTGNTSATGVVLSDAVPANTQVEPGSVQTSQGTIVGEDPVEIDLGPIDAGVTATVSFRVLIDDPFPFDSLEVANQASVASNELPAVLSDDPDTPAADDPTSTDVFIFPDLAVIGATETEADAAATGLVFTVTLSEPSNRLLGVEYQTEDQTAVAGLDYVAQSGEVSFLPGEISAPVTVFGLDDPFDELDETMKLNLVNLSGDTIAEGLGTILDDDAPPALAIDDVTVTEGDAGAAQALFTLSLSAPSAFDVSVDYATADGSATAGADYTAAAGTVVIPAGAVSGSLAVDVLGDAIDEPDESYFVDLLGPVNATLADAQGLGTILDDDEAEISIDDVAVDEGDAGTTDAVFTVTLTSALPADLTIDFTTVEDTATADVDYTSASGVLTIPAGSTTGSIAIAVAGDLVLEPDESFTLELSNPSSGTLVDGVGLGTILDDELCPGPNLIRNPGAEEPLEGGELPGWTEILGIEWQPRFGDPPPSEGAAYFFAGAADVAELIQEIDLGPYSAFIPVGDQAFQFEGAVRTFDELPADTARIIVEYRDTTNTVVLDAFDSGEITSVGAWQPVDDLRLAPAGTGWVRVRLLTARLGTGPTADGYFDALSLRSLRTPVVSIWDATATEGDTGTTPALFDVTLSCPITEEVSATWATAPGTASPDVDYQPVPPTVLILPAGTTAATAPVDVFGDTLEEADETFFVDLSGPANAVIVAPRATGLILDDDGAFFCPRSPGYWKNHLEAWPVTSLVIGGLLYGQSELLGFLESGVLDASLKLAGQLVATKLNLASGSDPAIQPVVDQADAFLAVHPPGSDPAGEDKEQALALKDALDDYNNQPCEDEESDNDLHSDSDQDSDKDSDQDSDDDGDSDSG